MGRSEALALLLDAEEISADRCYDLKLAHRIAEPGETLRAAVSGLKLRVKDLKLCLVSRECSHQDDYTKLINLKQNSFQRYGRALSTGTLLMSFGEDGRIVELKRLSPLNL